jgi:hypothetical protein
MRIIFLDMDGVLNSSKYFDSLGAAEYDGLSFGAGQIDPDAVELLDQLVDASDADIVISSSWRLIWNYHEIAEMLKGRGFKNHDRIIGQTNVADDDHRGNEVQDWLDTDRERQVVDEDAQPTIAYVILDDNNTFHSNQQAVFVHTNADVGLTPRDVALAVKILEGEL